MSFKLYSSYCYWCLKVPFFAFKISFHKTCTNRVDIGWHYILHFQPPKFTAIMSYMFMIYSFICIYPRHYGGYEIFHIHQSEYPLCECLCAFSYSSNQHRFIKVPFVSCNFVEAIWLQRWTRKMGYTNKVASKRKICPGRYTKKTCRWEFCPLLFIYEGPLGSQITI